VDIVAAMERLMAATFRPHFAGIMEILLSPEVYALLADPDVTELYFNPDGQVRIYTRSRGRHSTDLSLDTNRTRAFLNTVASSLRTPLGEASAMLEAELPKDTFRGARLQAFVPPRVPEVTSIIRNPPARVFRLDEFVAAQVLQPVPPGRSLALRRRDASRASR
jgi:Flp pilus assembly CpaF family ATPase